MGLGEVAIHRDANKIVEPVLNPAKFCDDPFLGPRAYLDHLEDELAIQLHCDNTNGHVVTHRRRLSTPRTRLSQVTQVADPLHLSTADGHDLSAPITDQTLREVLAISLDRLSRRSSLGRIGSREAGFLVLFSSTR
jgi:hypothetical protein